MGVKFKIASNLEAFKRLRSSQYRLFHVVPSGFDAVHKDSAILVLYPLDTVMRKQLQNEGKQKVTTPKKASVVRFLHI